MTEHDAALAALRKVAAARERIAKDETDAILAALRAGVGPVAIAREVKRSREHVRQVARNHGITK